jgi:hypothetical protein
MIDTKLLNCSNCNAPLEGMSIFCKKCAPEKKNKLSELKEVFIAHTCILSFMDYDNFQKMTAEFIFVQNSDNESQLERIVRTKDWDISKNGFIKESSRLEPLVDLNVYLDLENLSVGLIAKVAAMLSRTEVDKIADFIFNQKMIVSEKEITSICKKL